MNANVQRFDPIIHFDQGGSGYGQMKKETDGDYVSFEDYERLTEELAKANSRIIRSGKLIAELTSCCNDRLKTSEQLTAELTAERAKCAELEKWKEDECFHNKNMVESMGGFREGESFRELCKRLSSEHKQQAAQIEGLREAFAEYGHHAGCCSVVRFNKTCDCGYVEALADGARGNGG